jgi:hypothetical protein
VHVQIQLKEVDSVNKTALIEIQNTSFLADFWLYSMQLGVRFDNNFIQLLPGTHSIKISFEKTPVIGDFGFKYR